MATFHYSIKSGKKGTAEGHAAYIDRTGRHKSNNDLVAQDSGNLPEWANGSARALWRAADKHERKNGVAYREHEIALPNELSDAENIKIVKTIVAVVAQGKPFQFAVHKPIAALGGVAQPHVHIMVNERMPDGIERSEQQHFKRHNNVDPQKGGCKKDGCGLSKTEVKLALIEKRATVAGIINAGLAANGVDARVDPRSNRDRGLQNPPSQHLGPARVRQIFSSREEGDRSK